jgi:hypothetical protein
MNDEQAQGYTMKWEELSSLMELPAGCYGSPEKVEAWLRGDDA